MGDQIAGYWTNHDPEDKFAWIRPKGLNFHLTVIAITPLSFSTSGISCFASERDTQGLTGDGEATSVTGPKGPCGHQHVLMTFGTNSDFHSVVLSILIFMPRLRRIGELLRNLSLGLSFHYHSMVGIPTETRARAEATVTH
jgi:hypothetical protein